MIRARSLAPVGLLALAACLPEDVRPEPGSALVHASPHAAIRDGIVTDDGWTITFERVVTALGDLRLEDRFDAGDTSCVRYSSTNYETLFDFTKVEREKIGLVYGRGRCDVAFRMRGPSDESLIGTGATEKDRELMMVAGSDFWADDKRTSLIVVGRATKDGVEKRFDWRFRNSFQLRQCRADFEAEGNFVSTRQLAPGEPASVEVEVRPQELFRTEGRESAPFAFDPLAAADANDDGWIGLEELHEVKIDWDRWASDEGDEWLKLAELEGLPIFAPDDDDEDAFVPGGDELPSEGQRIYAVQLPRVTRQVGGFWCSAEVRRR